MARTVQSVLEAKKKKVGTAKKRERKPVKKFTISHEMPYRRYQGLRDKSKLKNKNAAYKSKKKLKSTDRKNRKDK